MRRALHLLVLLLVLLPCATTILSAQSTQPAARGPGQPPSPRDGESTQVVVTPILVYHSIRPYREDDSAGVRRYIATPESLDRELAWLRDGGYASVSFDDFASCLRNGSTLPRKPMIICFDDDWQGQYDYALPLLKKYGFTATFYVWTAVVGRKNHMTWDEIRELSAAGMEIGCHTVHHPYLTRINDEASLRKEMEGAKQRIESEIGKPVTTLAYPFGAYDEHVVDVARACGFMTARSTWPGILHNAEGLMSLTSLIGTESPRSLAEALTSSFEKAAPAVDEAVEAALGLGPSDAPLGLGTEFGSPPPTAP
jgi:peptidoglycan/xylan/chitin deacetylase (PgdA/CDA1 family)